MKYKNLILKNIASLTTDVKKIEFTLKKKKKTWIKNIGF